MASPNSSRRLGLSKSDARSPGPIHAAGSGDHVQHHKHLPSPRRRPSQLQQPVQGEINYYNPATSIKREAASESLHNLSLADHHQSSQMAPDVIPSKRRTIEEDPWPNKRSPSASPFSSAHHGQDRSQKQSPPPDSGGFHSVQTPVSSRPVSRHVASSSRQTTQTPIPYQDPDRKIFDPHSQDSDPDHDQDHDHDQDQDVTYEDTKMLLQPETRPISQEQLVNEVKGIYAGLVMVEKKCVEICQQQAQTTNKLSNEQWQALIALHRTLLHEHHDFFLASQHPTASPALRRLPTKYAMPARMWRHGIHSFLELLRHRLPYSLEHMLSFVYLAYQMMGLLMESVPAFHETWIECLGDLARYRMAIEEADMRDRETWSNVARTWYNKAADRSPDTGRIQHHLAVLSRPNIVCQLFYYSKALISVHPFPNARDSIMLLFNPLLEASSRGSQNPKQDSVSKYPKFDNSLVTAAGLLFTKGLVHDYFFHITQFTSELDSHIARSGSNWKVQGTEVASSLIACILDFGSEQNFLWKAFRAHSDKLKGTVTDQPHNDDTLNASFITKDDSHRKFWEENSINAKDFHQAAPPAGDQSDLKFGSSDEVTSYTLPVWSTATSIVASKVGDRNILPYMHLTLAFLWSLSYVPGALVYLENYVPWAKLALSLNTLSRSGVMDARVESKEFPQQQSGTGRQLPEDFPMRGLVWAPYYFPSDFFGGQVVDEDERTLELPSHAAPRAERCLWLGVRLASLNRYMTYNVSTKQFSCTEFALSLPGEIPSDTLRVQTPTTERDVPMTDV